MKHLSGSQDSSVRMFSKLFIASNMHLNLMLTGYYHVWYQQTLKNRLADLCHNQVSCFLNMMDFETI